MTYLYSSHLKSKSRRLRKNLTYGEATLWKRIKSKQLGVKFRRQFPILNYIVDFYCHELKLIIEVDGSSHTDSKYAYDRSREELLKSIGMRLIRLSDYDCRFRTDDVVQTIINLIE